ncbi:hypothetical protein TTHERM_00680690 (macronuclear) [Tetrahymena thermophila SB210]|uniref:Tetratricopeptide repeat protein n=1 Tax=Tetrahymena thermophila (strain SB210) TaxID=312017 RepID=I7LXZ7_TETTS|nr:hypothetical protein TTHERM_00680690 [Tetrahymena thermophila SB210]EAS07062.2 hypothetical protein TTHERM_00680690 [Tetrahymena thermophila SB210]|eukprot:XP_001027304.2 hypothetical protein TTHERM_00680690 [Tetrahymena thermophila SB210]
MFLSKLFYLSKKDDLVGVSFYSNTFPDSMITVAPSRLANYANSAKETCNGLKNLENYDARCRPWYKNAYINNRLVYSAPFLLQSTFVVGFTATQRLNAKDGSFISMFNQNLDLKNIKSKIFAPQDIYDESDSQEAYTILIYFTNQTVYHHRYWDPSSQVLKSWIDIEYNSSVSFDPQDKINFNNSVNYISQFAQNGSYNIVSRVNTTNFFFKFKRQNETYLSILYPVMVMSIQSSFTKEIIYNKPMLIGRVQKDRTHILEEVTLQFLPLNSMILKIELGLVFVWLLFNLLHFTIVLYKTQEIPLQKLIQAIKNNTIIQNENQKNKANSQKATNNYINNDNNNNLSQSQMKKYYAKDEYPSLSLGKNNNNINQSSALNKYQQNNQKLNKSIFKQSQIFTQLQNSKENISQLQLLAKFTQQQNEDNIIKNLNQLKQETNKTEEMQILNSSFHSSLQPSKNCREHMDEEDQLIGLDDVDLTFVEMQIIVHSIKGIFNLLKLAKMNSLMGNNDISILQFYQALDIFIQVKNFSQQIICYEQIGNQYLKIQKYSEAADSFQSALTIILQQLDFVSYGQVLDNLGEGNLNKENKQLYLDLAFDLKMLAIAQNEECNYNLEKKSFQDLNLEISSLKNINYAIQIYQNFQNDIEVQFKLIQAELVKAKILFIKNKVIALNYCNHLELEITANLMINNQIDQCFNKNVFKFEQSLICEQVLQQIFLIKQKINLYFRNYETGLQNLSDFLENNEFILEIAKYDSLQLINQIQEKTNVEKDPFLKYELEKYNKTKINMWIVIEVDPQSNIFQFERYQYQINQIINTLNEDDVVQFIIYDSQIQFNSCEFNSKNKLYLHLCFREFRNLQVQQIFQLQCKYLIDWVEIFSYTLSKMQSKIQNIPNQLKQKNLKSANSQYNIVEKQIVLLLTSNSNSNLKKNKLPQAVTFWQKIINDFEKNQQKVYFYHFKNSQSYNSDTLYSAQNLNDQNIINLKETIETNRFSLGNSTLNPNQIRSQTISTRKNTRSIQDHKPNLKKHQSKEGKEIQQTENFNSDQNNQNNEIEVDNDIIISELFQGLGINYLKSSDYSQILSQIKNLRYKNSQYYSSGIY